MREYQIEIDIRRLTCLNKIKKRLSGVADKLKYELFHILHIKLK